MLLPWSAQEQRLLADKWLGCAAGAVHHKHPGCGSEPASAPGGDKVHAPLVPQVQRPACWVPGIRPDHLPADDRPGWEATVRPDRHSCHHDRAWGEPGLAAWCSDKASINRLDACTHTTSRGSNQHCSVLSRPAEHDHRCTGRLPKQDQACALCVWLKLHQLLQNVQRYKELAAGSETLESQLKGASSFCEYLNAEVVLQTIRDVPTALFWVKSTFLYVRVRTTAPTRNSQPCRDAAAGADCPRCSGRQLFMHGLHSAQDPLLTLCAPPSAGGILRCTGCQLDPSAARLSWGSSSSSASYPAASSACCSTSWWGPSLCTPASALHAVLAALRQRTSLNLVTPRRWRRMMQACS